MTCYNDVTIDNAFCTLVTRHYLHRAYVYKVRTMLNNVLQMMNNVLIMLVTQDFLNTPIVVVTHTTLDIST